MLNCTNCYFHGDEITFNSDMTVNIYNKVQDSNWCDLKYLKGKTDKSMGNYKGFATAENTILNPNRRGSILFVDIKRYYNS